MHPQDRVFCVGAPHPLPKTPSTGVTDVPVGKKKQQKKLDTFGLNVSGAPLSDYFKASDDTRSMEPDVFQR